MFYRFSALGALLVSLLAGGATAGVASGTDQPLSLQVGAHLRTALLHLPPATAEGPLPVVIAFHGSRSNGRGMAAYTGFSKVADEEGFIAVYPDGLVEPRTWNALFGHVPGGSGVLGDEVDDVGFVRALIGHLRARYHADPQRVFVCGFSAGGYMAYRLAVELADQIAAAGVVCGSLGIKSVEGKPVAAVIPRPVAPISLMHVAGAKDNAVKLGGAQTPKNLFLPAAECVAHFVKANGCASPGRETRDTQHSVVRTLFTSGRAGTEVELVVVGEAGHQWPTEREGFAATRELWAFFSRHPKKETPSAGK
ncbi:MAG: PHB depolymerase family esterase [Armatimonadota bacterium]|nr:PHB depolymerase family esterase [Armatimonadota bacterium]